MFLRQYIYLNFVASAFLYVNGDTISNEKKHGDCILPSHPPNGKWLINGGLSDAQPGSAVPSHTIITYFCDEPYKPSSNYVVITCLGEYWDLPPPECLSGEGKTNKVKRAVVLNKNSYGEVVAVGDTDAQREKRYAQGGRGGDGIVIKSGGGRRVIGPGEEGSSYYSERGVGGQGGTGVIIGGLTGGGRGGGQTNYRGERGGYDGYYDELPEQNADWISRRGGDGVVIRNGRIRGNIVGIGGQGRSGGYYRRKRETVNEPILEGGEEKTNKVKRAVVQSKNSYGEVVAVGDTDNQREKRYAQGGRGGDGIVIKSGGGRRVIGPGEEGSSYYGERGVGGQGGTGVIIGGLTGGGRGGGGQTNYRGERGGYDEYYEELPEQNADWISRRGGDGVVIRNGRIRGNIVGIGGRGRSGGYYRRKRETVNEPILEGGEEKTNKVKRAVVQSKNSYGEVVAVGDTDNQREKRYAQGGRGGDGIVIKSGGGRRVIGPGEEGSSYYGERGVGGQGGTGVIIGGLTGGGRGGSQTNYRGERGGYDGYYDELPEQNADWISRRGGDGVVIRNGRIRGNIVGIGGRGRSGGYYRRKRETVNKPILEGGEEKTNKVKRAVVQSKNSYGEVVAVGDTVDRREKRYAQGGRGGDGIVIKSGGGRRVIGPGEEGSSYYSERGVGGQGGTGVIIGGLTGGGRGGGGQTNYRGQRGGYDGYYDELPEQNADWISRRGGDGVVVRNGRITGNIVGIGGRGRSGSYYRRKRETVNEPILEGGVEKTSKVKRAVILSRNAYGEVVAMEDNDYQRNNRYATQAGRGGDGIVIKSGKGRTVIGPGEEGSSYYDERGVARGGQGGTGYIRGGQGGSGWGGNTAQRGGGGQTYYGDGRRGQDGLVIGPGETVNGYGIGVGQPGGNGQRKGGRGGTGVVVDRGTVNGGLIGQGGYGGYGKYPNSNNNRKQGGRGGYGQGTGYYDGSLEENADWIGGRGGDGIVIRGGRIRGNIVGIGGRGGSGGYYRRKRAIQNPPIEDCGETRTKELIVDGKNVKKTIFPWMTAIYKKINGEFTYICAGTMLTKRIIVTVAHCITNQDNGAIPVQELKIAVGKFYHDYNNPKDTQAQFADVMKVLVNPNYRGIYQNYQSDIGFLITKDHLLLSKVVQPVCYQNLRNIDLEVGMEGMLTGWGFPDSTSVSPSNELQGISLPFQTETTCSKELPKHFVDNFLTYDKMCTGHYNKNMNFCLGFSGNSLTFSHNGRYYIHGINALGFRNSSEGLCNAPAKTTLYTKVSAHYDWLERVISQYQ